MSALSPPDRQAPASAPGPDAGLPGEATAHAFTEEQREAIARREGEMLLDAGAGSGKTTVLVERFVRTVLEDGVDPAAILAITFTEKAAAELRDRIRARLRTAGAAAAVQATEAAPIGTIHGFCARVLRGNAVAAGLDPGFTVLDAATAARLAGDAFTRVLDGLDALPGGRQLIAVYRSAGLREAILTAHSELRSRGQRAPRLPALPAPPDLEAARSGLRAARAALAAELGALDGPGRRVQDALGLLGRCASTLEEAAPWPGGLAELSLPGGAAALTSDACRVYEAALREFRGACGHPHAVEVHGLLDEALAIFGREYEALKAAVWALDFADLELRARDLVSGSSALRDRLQARFRAVMVDEFQDTNRVQLELIEAVSDGNLFTVGDAQQSIYGFRHADVELFLERARRLAARGQRLTLQTNFRSRAEVLGPVEQAFSEELGAEFMPLLVGRAEPPAGEARVELIVADKAGEWEREEGAVAPWRLAEARVLAGRIAELTGAGTPAREIVVLVRATTDMRVYERALEDRGVPTYVIGGRGYWEHPQVVDLVAYLTALANPLEEEALLGVLASPLVGASLDALVLLCAAARGRRGGVWEVLQGGLPEDVPGRERLGEFASWFAGERAAAAREGADALIDRALAWSGYDLVMLGMPGGRRRLANARKLMRLARDHESEHGPDLRGFVDGLTRGGADPRESEAPVEGEALDAVRLMTIHRAKGLEFPVTCVADLGRAPRRYPELLRLGRDGRIGLGLMALGRHGREPVLEHDALGIERDEREAREERRLFYVACTRARERLILSGAAKLEGWAAGGAPVGWLAPALLGGAEGLRAAVAAGEGEVGGVRFRFPAAVEALGGGPGPASGEPAGEQVSGGVAGWGSLDPAAGEEGPGGGAAAEAGGPARLSYSALAEYARCGYRFYAERVLRLPAEPEAEAAERRSGVAGREGRGGEPGTALGAAERGVLIHALLERLDFRRPVAPALPAVAALAPPGPRAPSTDEMGAVASVIERFGRSELCRRLAGIREVRREERFAFALADGTLMAGVFDVLAREGAGSLLVVDYKSDRLGGVEPGEVVGREYRTQQLVYGLAALGSGAASVEVVHVFLERPEAPVAVRLTSADAAGLEAELERVTAEVRSGRFEVTAEPRRAICLGCPAEGGLCSYPLAMTRRESAATLF